MTPQSIRTFDTKRGFQAVTFDVAQVTPASAPLPEVRYKEAVEALLQAPPSELPARYRRMMPAEKHPLAPVPMRRVEACSSYHGRLVADVEFHPVIAAIDRAFADHRPLILSPDIVWLLIAQGFANHVNANAEELRPKLVEHQGKATITVRRDDFIKGSLENPWPEVFGEFSSQIREHVGIATHDLLVPSFSTTSAVERAAAEVVLMASMRSYFSYELQTACGIPQIALEGTMDDWELLAERTRRLGEFGLDLWTATLAPILNEFVAAARGHVNTQFWQSIYKLEGGSGGPFCTGWITAFFPYLKNRHTGEATQKNPWLEKGGGELQNLLYPREDKNLDPFRHRPTTESFPSGLARAPFRWQYLEQSFDMEFLGGFVGVRQDAETLRLRPEIGWAVREGSAE